MRPVDVQIEKASGIIDEYRTMYTADTPEDDELYKDVSELYFVKEVAAISEAYAYLAELRLRRHEGMLGFFGGKARHSFFLLVALSCTGFYEL